MLHNDGDTVRGRVIWYDVRSGRGYIALDDGTEDAYVCRRGLASLRYTPQPGDLVEFESIGPRPGYSNPIAQSVRPVAEIESQA